MPTSGLNKKQKLAIEKFIEYGNKTKAYREVYECQMDSRECNREMNRILDLPGAKEYLELIRQQSIERLGDLAEYLARTLLDDIEWRGENGERSKTWQKSVDLLQKQQGLQTAKLNVDQKTEVVINID